MIKIVMIRDDNNMILLNALTMWGNLCDKIRCHL